MKNLKSFISTCMFAIFVFVVPFLYMEATSEKEGTPHTDAETVAALDRKIAENRQLPEAQMTREPIGYFDADLRWIPFDRTGKP